LYGRYEKIAKIGQGTFGEVFKARCRSDKNKIVALKKVLMENEKEVRFLDSVYCSFVSLSVPKKMFIRYISCK
jgi:serine/threonine protein kinase